MGATCPGLWQLWQFLCNTGSTSFANVTVNDGEGACCGAGCLAAARPAKAAEQQSVSRMIRPKRVPRFFMALPPCEPDVLVDYPPNEPASLADRPGGRAG